MFIGAWASGRIVEAYTLTDPAGVMAHDWRTIWLVPAAGAFAILLLFAGLFRPAAAPEPAPAPAVAGD
ncbi:hypothetical protein D3C83_109440 [compost metagenome]